MELLSGDNLSKFIILIVPGIITLYFRAQFLTGKLPPVAEGSVAYAVISLVYFALLFTITKLAKIDASLVIANTWYWIAVLFIGPTVLGVLMGLNSRKQWVRNAISKLGIGVAHPIETAWDWCFSNMEPAWVIVVLKDGTRWQGRLGENSFASSELGHRDLFLEAVYVRKGDDDPWEPTGTKVLITGGEIQSIEIYDQN